MIKPHVVLKEFQIFKEDIGGKEISCFSFRVPGKGSRLPAVQTFWPGKLPRALKASTC
jgi:hypothetical protein